MAEKDILGRAGEDRAAQHFVERGYAVLDRNWRAPGGELDLVVASARELVVVEVKTRRTAGFGHPLEAVDARKRSRVWRLAIAWAAAHPEAVRGRRLRIDAVGIIGPDPLTGSIEHIEDVA